MFPVMLGGGHYGQYAVCQRRRFYHMEPFVIYAMQSCPLTNYNEEQELAILVDYGCSDGVNSMQWIIPALETLEKRQEKIQVQIFMVDLPTNDWNYFFRKVLPTFPSTGVLTSAIGASFYSQVVPVATVSFGIASTACHWLSGVPCQLNDNIFALCSTNMQEMATWKEFARKDWDQFLHVRALELKTGGILLVSASLLVDGDRVYCLLHKIETAVKILHKNGHISEKQYKQLNIPEYWRSLEEFLTFSKDIPLQLQHKVYQEYSPLYKQFEEDKDLEKFCDNYVAYVRASQEPIIKCQLLTTQDNPTKDIDETLIILWQTFKELIRHSAAELSFGNHITLMFQKTQ